ncbi:8247_t:CDS:2, partial [Acaulospora morrowiae]
HEARHALFVMENVGVMDYMANGIKPERNIVLPATVQRQKLKVANMQARQEHWDSLISLMLDYQFPIYGNNCLYLLVKQFKRAMAEGTGCRVCGAFQNEGGIDTLR